MRNLLKLGMLAGAAALAYVVVSDEGLRVGDEAMVDVRALPGGLTSPEGSALAALVPGNRLDFRLALLVSRVDDKFVTGRVVGLALPDGSGGETVTPLSGPVVTLDRKGVTGVRRGGKLVA